MDTAEKTPKNMTWVDIRETLAEATLLSKENEKGLKELKESIAKMEMAVDKTTKSVEATTKGIDKLYKTIGGVKEELGGISSSNGMYAEDHFYASLRETKMFGGVHFDEVEQNVGGMLKFKDGTKLRGQFDVVLYNDTAICLIEVKYRLRKEDILKAIEKDVDNFKKLFPVYEKYNFYLAVGGMAIDDKVIETAEQHGVGVVKLMGGKVEILDKNLKVY